MAFVLLAPAPGTESAESSEASVGFRACFVSIKENDQPGHLHAFSGRI